ncbi:MAG TPA: cytochrome b N-terminal domain-containing protein [Rickettsiales bacterium]|nr:cytochrome b N-terminal domain-containing protein [Rickettsiales bacterium]
MHHNDNTSSVQGEQNGAQGIGTTIKNWIEFRLPIFSLLDGVLGSYPAPKNLNYLWNFGSLAGMVLVIQLLTGIFLAMHYTPHSAMAFDSVENIMRNVNYGWLMRYMHAVGASMFFVTVYIHIFRNLYYGSYKYPREMLWWLGIVIMLLMMATAFMGYVLPWGQMSFWGATVITNLFSAFPIVGPHIVTWLWGGYSVDNPTLNRFFALHYLLPFVLIGIIILHIWALHQHGSNNPTGVDVKTKKDTVPFNPYYTIKDLFGIGVFLIFFNYLVFFHPNALGDPDNYIPANPMVTPAHIVPEWYFLPFYAILRAVPDKLCGVLAMFGAIILLFFLPWLDYSKVRSAKYRPIFKWAFWVLLLDCVALGYLGGKPPEGIYVILGRAAAIYYYLHFLVLVPLIARFEKPLPLPESIDASVKGH